MPLGYDVKDRKLIVNEPEAATVRVIFQRCAELGSVSLLRAEVGAIISVITTEAREAEYYRAKLARFRSLSHLTVEVNFCTHKTSDHGDALVSAD